MAVGDAEYGSSNILGGIIGAIREEMARGFRWFLNIAQDAFIILTVTIIAIMTFLWLINCLWTLCTDRKFERVCRIGTFVWRWVRFRLHIVGIVDWAEAPAIYQPQQPQQQQIEMNPEWR